MKISLVILASVALLLNSTGFAQTTSTAVTTMTNFQTKVVTLSTTYNGNGWASNVFNLTTNQIVTLNNVIGSVYPYVYFTSASGLSVPYNPQTYSSTGLQITYTGLTKVALTAYNGTSMATFTILTPSTNSVTYTPANSVVIPTSATGNVQIILQSSSDLVNWVSSLPGTYGSNYTNRFFRVIAVAQ